MRFLKSLKGRLTVMVAVAVIATGIIILLYGYFLAYSTLKEQVFESINGVVSRTTRQITASNERMSSQALMTTSDPRMVQALEQYVSGAGDPAALELELERILGEETRVDPSITDISLYAPDGSVVATTREGVPPAEHLGKKDDFSSIMSVVSTGTGTWMDFSYNGKNVLVTTVAGVVRPGVGGLLGVAVFDGEATQLEHEMTDKAGLGKSGRIMLSKLDGDTVLVMELTPRVGDTYKGRVVTVSGSSKQPPAKAAEGENGSGEFKEPGDGRIVAAYRQVPEVAWGVTAAMDKGDAFAPINRLRNVIVLVILVLLLGGTALAYLIATSISRPLEELQFGVKALSGGDLSTRVTIKDGLEVTALADEFNRMAERLKELYDGLESKVEERTMELSEANRRLKELDDLKSEFVSITSHELRSPLSSMKMGVSTVYNEVIGPLNEEQKLMLEIANRNIDRLTKLTTDLLDLAKIEAGQLDLELGEFDVAELAEDVVEANRSKAEHQGLLLKVESGDGLLLARCDRDRTYQVIQNLVSNALKFTESGGIAVRVERKDETILVAVTDTGRGIGPEALPTIFEEFSQAHADTQSEDKGTGLGLAISRGIVEAQGGEITVESEPGKGSTFTLTLPVRGPDEREEADTDS